MKNCGENRCDANNDLGSMAGSAKRRARSAHDRLLKHLNEAKRAAVDLHVMGAVELNDHRLRCCADSMKSLCDASYMIALDLVHVLPNVASEP